jgi:hypothetical protein
MRIAVSSVSIAMLTPAQKPRGPARRIFIVRSRLELTGAGGGQERKQIS